MHENHLVDKRHSTCACLRVELFATLWTVAHRLFCPRGFSRQEYWSWLPCPPPGDLPDPGMEPVFPALQETAPPGKPKRSGSPFLSRPTVNGYEARAHNLYLLNPLALSPCIPAFLHLDSSHFQRCEVGFALETEHGSSTLQIPAFWFFLFPRTSSTNLCMPHLFFLEQK